jgi:membrane-bound lytic murein transglycosylase B
MDADSGAVENRTMLTRRRLATVLAAPVALPRLALADDFSSYIKDFRRRAHAKGIGETTLEVAFRSARYEPQVVAADRHQPEFTLTWEQYRSRVVSASRISDGRARYAANRDVIARAVQRYGAAPSPIMGIWGLESDYGAATGGYSVISALATLAYDGRRRAYFESELLDALRIIQRGDIDPARMTGSYAGAMGQPQFMPDSFLRYAVDFSGDGKRDIWGNPADVFGSIANYLQSIGWNKALPWGEQVTLPAAFDMGAAGRAHRRPLGEWARLGVRPAAARPETAVASVILPGGKGGEAYLAYEPNFGALRDYNPSDFYCISVGLLGDAVTA